METEAVQKDESAQKEEESMEVTKESAEVTEKSAEVTEESAEVTEESAEVTEESSELTEEAALIKEETTEDISELEQKIISQIEYYFGNYNLSRDKFMKELLKENDGWVPLETMLKFKRLKSFTEEASVIVTALKKAPNQLIEVNEDETQIRRSMTNPVPEDHSWKDMENRTVHVKGFHPKNTNLDSLLQFFESFGSYENVTMRHKKNSRNFKGSVFVTFKTPESAENFAKLPTVKYKGIELIREMKVDYVTRKNTYYQEVREERAAKRKRKLEENGGAEKPEEEESKAETLSEKDIIRGCLLKLTGLTEKTMWEHIKGAVKMHGDVAYVDYSMGKPEAIVRFVNPVAAEVIEKFETGEDGQRTVKITDVDAIATLVEGEAELEFWRELKQKRLERKGIKGKKHSGKGQNNWKNFGHKKGGRKFGRGQNDDSGPPKKRARTEAASSS